MPLTVLEIVWDGRFARWMQRRGWGGVTTPTWFGTWIHYWMDRDEQVAAHEAVHVAQAVRYGVTGFWLRYWWGLLRHGYRAHPMEIEAREAE